MGFTFKENVPDTRNTKVADLVRTLRDFVAEVVVYDPMADVALAKHEYGLDAHQRSAARAVRRDHSRRQA